MLGNGNTTLDKGGEGIKQGNQPSQLVLDKFFLMRKK